MLVVDQQLCYCQTCGRKTVHFRNNKRMSWGMHIFLAIITLGSWVFVWFFIALWHAISKPIAGRFACSACDTKASLTPTFDAMARPRPKAAPAAVKGRTLPQMRKSSR